MTEEQPETPVDEQEPDPAAPPVDEQDPPTEPEVAPVLSYDTSSPDDLLCESMNRPTEPPTTARGQLARDMVYACDQVGELRRQADAMEARAAQARDAVTSLDAMGNAG